MRLSGLRQRQIGVSPQGQQLFFSTVPVLVPPGLGAVWHDHQVQAPAIGQLEWFVARFGLLNGRIGEHGSMPFGWVFLNLPPKR